MATAILSAIVALFGLIGTALTSGVNSSKKENAHLKEENARLKAYIIASLKAHVATQAAADLECGEAVARREKVIAELKAEIELLEKDHEAQKDPAAVRARLSRLLNPV